VEEPVCERDAKAEQHEDRHGRDQWPAGADAAAVNLERSFETKRGRAYPRGLPGVRQNEATGERLMRRRGNEDGRA
jgi:hypothetical protein